MKMGWNKEQVFAICDEIRRIRTEIPSGVKSGLPPSERPRERVEAMKAFAAKLGTSPEGISAIYRGKIGYTRGWVIEWRQRNGVGIADETNGVLRPRPYHKLPDETVALAKKLRDEGASYSDISRKTGINKGTLPGLMARLNGQAPRKLARRNEKKAKPSDFEACLTKYIDEREAKARAEMEARHADEREELDRKLAAAREQAVERLADFYTDPTTNEA